MSPRSPMPDPTQPPMTLMTPAEVGDVLNVTSGTVTRCPCASGTPRRRSPVRCPLPVRRGDQSSDNTVERQVGRRHGPTPELLRAQTAALQLHRGPVVLQVRRKRFALGGDSRDARTVIVRPARREIIVGQAGLGRDRVRSTVAHRTKSWPSLAILSRCGGACSDTYHLDGAAGAERHLTTLFSSASPEGWEPVGSAHPLNLHHREREPTPGVERATLKITARETT